jgi:hypothetical protein
MITEHIHSHIHRKRDPTGGEGKNKRGSKVAIGGRETRGRGENMKQSK